MRISNVTTGGGKGSWSIYKDEIKQCERELAKTVMNNGLKEERQDSSNKRMSPTAKSKTSAQSVADRKTLDAFVAVGGAFPLH